MGRAEWIIALLKDPTKGFFDISGNSRKQYDRVYCVDLQRSQELGSAVIVCCWTRTISAASVWLACETDRAKDSNLANGTHRSCLCPRQTLSYSNGALDA